MKSLPVAVQSIIASEVSHPVTAVIITLRDASSTVLRLCDQHDRSGAPLLTIDGDDYDPVLIAPPRIVASADDGIDVATIEINNGDEAFSSFDNADYFNGARCEIRRYFATDGTYTDFEGPVLGFPGSISSPETSSDGIMRLQVTADSRAASEGFIGRQITGRCLNVFRDANCGYTHSCTIETGATYPAETLIDINESLQPGQSGLGHVAMRILSGQVGQQQFKLQIRRGGDFPAGTVVLDDLDLFGTDFVNGNARIAFAQEVTVQAGDRVEFMFCPRDSMSTCANRWKIGSASRQQDRFAGLDYFYGERYKMAQAQYPDLVDHIIPIPYGTRWIEPLLMGAHLDRTANGDWASWQTSRRGPFVVALVGEGVVQAPIAGAPSAYNENVELDGVPLNQIAIYAQLSGGLPPSDWFTLHTGTAPQTPSDFAPRKARAYWDKVIEFTNRAGAFLPGLPGFDHVAYAVIDLPNTYELGERSQVEDLLLSQKGSTEDRLKAVSDVPRRWSMQKPQLRLRYEGRVIETWNTAGTSLGTSMSRSPVFQIADLLTALERVAPSDHFSAGLTQSDLDLVSFGKWGLYGNTTIDVFDEAGDSVSVPRFQSGIYITSGNKNAALNELLRACRGSLVYRNGKIGIVCDAPVGGKGTLTNVSGVTLTDSKRTDDSDANRQIPEFPPELLVGLTCEMLDGAAAGQTRLITSNNQEAWNLASVFSPAPSPGDTYAIYALRLTADNLGGIRRKKLKPENQIPNRILASWQSDEHRGQEIKYVVKESLDAADESGATHEDRYGAIEEGIDYQAITDFEHAIPLAWYELRKGLDTNRMWEASGVNIEALPLEVGDICLLTHPTDGVSDETVRVERITDVGDGSFDLELRLYREHIYANWPDDTFDALGISSTLKSPHEIPPHVENLTVEAVHDDPDDNPVVQLSFDLPPWPYSGWHVLIEYNTNADPVWRQADDVVSARASFRAAQAASYNFRAVFVNHVGVRADDSLHVGQSTGGSGSNNLVDTNQNWAEDELAGWMVRITAGTNAGEEFIVESNVATQLFLESGSTWTVAPDATSEYKIYRPADVVSVVVVGIPELLNFRDRELADDEGVRYDWSVNAAVDEVRIYDRLVALPETGENWPLQGAVPTVTLASTDPQTYTAAAPPGGFVRLIQVVPYDASARPGPYRRARISARGLSVIIPAVTPQAKQEGNLCTLTLEISDPDLRVTAVRFKSISGAGDFDTTDPLDGSWTEDPTPPYEDTEIAAAKHGCRIAGAVGYLDEQGNLQWQVLVHPFDADQIAEIETPTVTFDAAGVIVAGVGCDEDGDTIFATAAVGVPPADPQETSPSLVGRSGAIPTGVVCPYGSKAFVKARARGPNGLGPVKENNAIRGQGVVAGKVLTLPAGMFLPVSESTPYSINSGEMTTTSGGLRIFEAAVPIPPGATLKEIRANWRRTSGVDFISLALHRRQSLATSFESLAVLSYQSGMGSGNNEHFQAMNHLVAPGYVYFCILNLREDAAGDAAFLWFRLTYDASDVHVSL